MKTKFAAERMKHVHADLAQIGELVDMANRESLDAVYVRARMVEIERLRLAVVDQLRRGIEPLLERADPPLEKRVGALEEQVQSLTEQIQKLTGEYTIAPVRKHVER